MTPEDLATNSKLRAAYHEAGHAYMAILYRRSLRTVWIRESADEGQWVGETVARRQPRPTRRHPEWLEGARLRVAVWGMAGMAAEAKLLRSRGVPEECSHWSSADIADVEESLTAMGGTEFLHEHARAYCMARAYDALQAGWTGVQRIAEALMEHGRLTGRQARRLARGFPYQEAGE